MIEVWRDIEGYEGLYQVSSFGRVKSLDRVVADKNRKRTRTFKERILKNVCEQTGYHFVSLHKNSSRAERRSVHRIVAKTFDPLFTPECIVDHINGIRTDNRVGNLRCVTFFENNRNTPYTRYLQNLLETNNIPYLRDYEFES